MAFNFDLYFIAVVVVALTTGSILFLRSRKKTGIRTLGGSSLYNAYKFIIRRYDFMQVNLGNAHMFQFYVVRHRVVAMSGAAARKVFFNQKVDAFKPYSLDKLLIIF